MLRTYKGDLTRGTNPDFFIGNEVEKTAAFGMKTLFCHGVLKYWRIAEELKNHPDIRHVYLNHNHTHLDDRENKVIVLTDAGYTVTEEVQYSRMLDLTAYNENHIILVSIPIQFVESSSVYLKIDDYGFNSTNSGVWTFNVKDMDEYKTSWDAYSNDEIIE